MEGQMATGMGGTYRQDSCLQQALMAQAEGACQMGAQGVAVFLADLVAKGDLTCEIVPVVEDLSTDEVEDEFDAEMDLSDEDIDCSDAELAEEGERQAFTTDYELTVSRRSDGTVACEVPDIGFGGYCARTMVGSMVLTQLTKRQKAFQAIAAWVENNEALKQATSVEAFLESYTPGTQTAFLGDSCDVDIKEGEFSQFIRNACLVFADERDVRLPLRRLFK